MRMVAVGMMFCRAPRGNIFLATMDMVAPVSITTRYPYPPRQIRTQNTPESVLVKGLPEG